MTLDEAKRQFPHCKAVESEGKITVYAYPENLLDVFVNDKAVVFDVLNNKNKNIELMISTKEYGADQSRDNVASDKKKYAVKFDKNEIADFLISICKTTYQSDDVDLIFDRDHALSMAESIMNRIPLENK